MTVRTAFSKTLSSESGTQNYSYSVLIPGTSVTQSGAVARLKFIGGTQPLSMQDVYAGPKGTGAGDFSSAPVPVKIGGSSSWTIPAGGVVWSDPFVLAVVSGQPIILRYDVPDYAGQKYKYNSAISGAVLHYKSGNRGAGNADLLLGAGYSSLSGWVAAVSAIEVADALEDFDPPETPSAGLGMLSELEERALANQLGAAAQGFAGEPGKRTAFSYQVASDKGVYGFLDMVTITPDADCEVAIVSAVAPPEATIFNVHCNTNYNGGVGTKSRARHWKTTLLPDQVGGRHTAYRLKGGVARDLFIPRSFLGVIHPGGGICLVLDTPGVGAHIAMDWHEKPVG